MQTLVKGVHYPSGWLRRFYGYSLRKNLSLDEISYTTKVSPPEGSSAYVTHLNRPAQKRVPFQSIAHEKDYRGYVGSDIP